MSRHRIGTAWQRLPHPVRWVGAAAAGTTLILVGLVLMVTPGPGIPILILGLVVLATEFAWAERSLHRLRSTSLDIAGRITRPFTHNTKEAHDTHDSDAQPPR